MAIAAPLKRPAELHSESNGVHLGAVAMVPSGTQVQKLGVLALPGAQANNRRREENAVTDDEK